MQRHMAGMMPAHCVIGEIMFKTLMTALAALGLVVNNVT